MPRRPPRPELETLQFEHIVPMLATPSRALPHTGAPHHSFKYDGYRALASREQVRTRRGADATAWFPEIPIERINSVTTLAVTGCGLAPCALTPLLPLGTH